MNAIRGGATVMVPEIADYEARRELIRRADHRSRVRGNDFDVALRYGISTVAPSVVPDSSASWAFTASSSGYS